MKFAQILMALLLLATTSAGAQILTGQTMYLQRSGYWQSFLLLLQNSVSARAATGSLQNDGTALVFDFFPKECNPAMRLIIPLSQVAAQDAVRSDILITLRVDAGARTDFLATSYVSMGDTSFMLLVPGSDSLTSEISEMSRGQMLRMKLVAGGEESKAAYGSFSMIGMTAAFRRASTMCANPASIWR